MLDERIERCSEIGDSEGLYFVWKNLMSGVTSLDSLTHLCLHHNGQLNVNVHYTILLFIQLQIIELHNDSISVTKEFYKDSSLDKKSFLDWFSKFLLQFFLEEKVIDLENILYDSHLDKYILPRSNIKYRHASYRNLLLSLSLLHKREDGNYYIGEFFSNIIARENNTRSKISEATLIKMLEEQRFEGEAGENFVIDFEQKRLALHCEKAKIKRISLLDINAGYDIISYNNIYSNHLDRFIEVKTYKGKPHFHWSSNEIKTAKLRLNHYFLYLVDFNKISQPSYEPYIICDPISFFEKNTQWDVTAESFLLKKIR